MSENSVLLGFEIGTGKPVYIPMHHLAVFGMTQLSGKTTTLEALISRANYRAIAFIVKRGETGFTNYKLIPPYYKPRADWQFVEGLVNVALGEKVKYEPGMRYGIIKVCKGRTNLREIQQAARQMASKTKSRFMQSVYEKLAEYLDLVIPELEKWTFSDKLELHEGVNVMDLSEMPMEIQHLVISSTIEYAFRNLDHVIVIIPEAWETLPQGKMTAVKWVAQQFIRKGAAIGNYLWLDSQDIGGIDKTPLRQCDIWLMGRMKEAHEVERVIKQLLGAKIKREEIQTLPLGHFYAVFGNKVKKVYVLPSGVPEEIGVKVAKGELSPEYVRDHFLKPRLEEVDTDLVYKEKWEEEKRKREELEKRVKEIERINKGLSERIEELEKINKSLAEKANKRLEKYKKDHELVENLRNILSRLVSPIGIETKVTQRAEVPSEVKVVTEQPTLTVEIRRKPLTLSSDDLVGRVAIIYADGFFDEQEKTVSQVQKEMIRRGWSKDPRLANALNQLCLWGYLRKRRTDRWLYKAVILSTEAKSKGLLKIEEKLDSSV